MDCEPRPGDPAAWAGTVEKSRPSTVESPRDTSLPHARRWLPSHAGALDVDIVIDLQILAGGTGAYHTLEDNLRRMGFDAPENDSERSYPAMADPHRTRCADGARTAGGCTGHRRRQGSAAAGQAQISALNIPHSSIVSTWQISRSQAELLGAWDRRPKDQAANLITTVSCLEVPLRSTSASNAGRARPDLLAEHAPEEWTPWPRPSTRCGGKRTARSSDVLRSDAAVSRTTKTRLPQDGPVSVIAEFDWAKAASGQREARRCASARQRRLIAQLLAGSVDGEDMA